MVRSDMNILKKVTFREESDEQTGYKESCY